MYQFNYQKAGSADEAASAVSSIVRSPSPTGTEASPPEGVPAPTEEEQGAPPLSPAGAASAPRRSRRGAAPVEDSFLPCYYFLVTYYIHNAGVLDPIGNAGVLHNGGALL